jgi:hypothetical protein
MFDAHKKYSPVGSMLPFGRFEYASLPPPDALRSVMFGATTSACIDPSSRKQTISFVRARLEAPALLLHASCELTGRPYWELLWAMCPTPGPLHDGIA